MYQQDSIPGLCAEAQSAGPGGTRVPVEFRTPPAPSTPLHYRFLDSPVGALLLVGDATALTRIQLGATAQDVAPEWLPAPCGFSSTTEQLVAYFEGKLTRFDLPLAPEGTPFQRRVWRALSTVPYGQTTSYGVLAGRVDPPTGARAVGLANGRNPLPIVLPCHRIVGADGALTGYSGGISIKEWLLRHERDNRSSHRC
ncbi:methylated-DNA--[protein]-cysteine S-methyltransferase [Lipingzhangella sp. LS1_29]|uniref:Methylated-DNA--protein-cysteine methyltransferase n=1 Tax=Lipingzhangella rawalii TaxID=2055835 RepID=A0ABU2H4T6_9ACTN|nr:methylated-DNA--[protein]-cysteine S-methyltransferase [Lipingzhangella rawalii]MDS1270306.1 methylated-DNA--[protein]-cysteine S-methyltransferase [Lipingzhangella rawalii]